MQWSKLLSISRTPKQIHYNTTDALRSGFEVDYDRIIFSNPFRSLQDKTQVFPLPDHAFVHTRLTHSLEVSSVGRSLGKEVGNYILSQDKSLVDKGYSIHDFGAIVAAASLAHDIGNPPFGHSGETAISEFYEHHPTSQVFKQYLNEDEWSDLINFEGNAQGFRLLTKPNNKSLQLTYATLATFTKYPCQSRLTHRDKSRKSQKKYGFFQSEKEKFKSIAESLGLKPISTEGECSWSRHPLVFLVEAADDICYNIIDLEDGCRLGFVSFEEVRSLLANILGNSYNHEKLMNYVSLDERLGILRAMAISCLIQEVTELFKDKESELLSGTYDKSLIDNIPSAPILKQIGDLSIKRIYQSDQVMEREMAGFKVIEGILESFSKSLFNKYFDFEAFTKRQRHILRFFPETLTHEIESGEIGVYKMLVSLNDYVSGLTDSQALSVFRLLNGISVTGKKVF